MTLRRKWSQRRLARSIAALAVEAQEACWSLFQGKSCLDLVELESAVSQLENGQAKAGNEDYAFLLKQCGSLQSLPHGNRVLTIVGSTRDRYLSNLAMEMYGKCKAPAGAAAIFREIYKPNIYSWTMLMLAYGQNGLEKEALVVFSLMDLDGVPPSKVTFSAALNMCSRLRSYRLARDMHFCLDSSGLGNDVTLQTTTLSMYAKCWKLQEAKQTFDRMEVKSDVTWNAMISAYTQHGCARQALETFWRMDQEGVKPNDVTFVCLVETWTLLGDVAEVNKLEQRVREIGYSFARSLQNAILCFYGRHGRLEDSRRVFDALPCKHTAAWNAIMGVYSQQGLLKEAMDLYEQMKREEVQPDAITFVVVLDACSNLGKLPLGKMVHRDMAAHDFKEDPILINVLLNMYGRCGSLDAARAVFAEMKFKTAAAWNSMMTQYAQHGRGSYALELFLDMQVEGVELDDITFITVLSLCSHMGHLREGLDFFFALKRDYGVLYTVEHYGCLVDLLGRTGMLEEAEQLLDTMPFEANPVICTSLLNSCRLHGDVERGTAAAERAIVVEPEGDATILVLEQIYTNAGRVDEFPKVEAALQRLRCEALDEQLSEEQHG